MSDHYSKRMGCRARVSDTGDVTKEGERMRQDAILTVRVARIDQETPVVKRFTLVLWGRTDLPPFSAGAHITTYAAFDGRVFERNYSLCNHPGMRNVYEIAIRRSDCSTGRLRGLAPSHSGGRHGAHQSSEKPFPAEPARKHHIYSQRGSASRRFCR